MDEKEKFLRAIGYATAKGAWVDVSRLDINRSSEKNGEYLLRTSGMAIIARIPLEELSKVPIADVELLGEAGPNGLRAIRELRIESSPAEKAVASASRSSSIRCRRLGSIPTVWGMCF